MVKLPIMLGSREKKMKTHNKVLFGNLVFFSYFLVLQWGEKY